MPDMTKDPAILKITDKIREAAANGDYIVSDVVCREGGREYQFVDLVMEGGGTLGVALVGYIHALEQAGIRFLGMGGSSVGAIVALLAYSCGGRLEEKSGKLAQVIADMSFDEMVDGSFLAKRFSRLLGNSNAKLRWLRTRLGIAVSIPRVVKKLGLNPGDKLYGWISDKLSDNGVHTLEDLQKLIQALPDGMVHRETGAAIKGYDTSLRIVAADITTSTKVVFPDMAAMYWQQPERVNPAAFARASASIPFFFQPFTVGNISQLIENSENWERLGSFKGTLPDKVLFTDGGMLSNFPIDLFKRPGVPRAPTFGARLGNKHRSAKDVDKFKHYAGRLFDSLRHYADFDFIFKNPLYKSLVAHINTDGYNWLDFNMGREVKLGLFREGVQAGYDFLENFKWGQYKDLRAEEFAMRRPGARAEEPKQAD